MKNNVLSIITFLLISNTVFCQNLDIKSAILYKKINREWQPSTKYEYDVNLSSERKTISIATDNGWQVKEIHTGHYSPNRDTITMTTTYWEDGIFQREVTTKCHEGAKLNGYLKDHNGRKYYIQCHALTYPFHFVINKADDLWRQGIPLENETIEWASCVSHTFHLIPDKYNRLLEMESEISKVVLTYHTDVSIALEDLRPPASQVYPNPFFEELFIELPLNDVHSIEILNNFGQRVYFLEIKNQTKIKIELPNLTAGFYTLNLYHANQISSQKLIKH